MLQWVEQHQQQIIWTTAISAVFFVLSVIVAGVVVVRLPADYFSKEGRRRRDGASAAWRIARNVMGWLLIAAGAAMLVLPGQGVLVLLIGVMLADFPGKPRVERWIISRGRVLRTINRVRRWFGTPPLESPAPASHPATGAPATR